MPHNVPRSGPYSHSYFFWTSQLFADVSFSTEGIVIIGVLIGALAGTVTALFKMLLAAKESIIKQLASERESYKEIAAESVVNLEAVARKHFMEAGIKPPIPLAAVVPEHHSPTTEEQQATADLQTMRARLVAATLQLELPPRIAAPPAKGSKHENPAPPTEATTTPDTPKDT